DDETITVAGRILGPDGKPVAGAKLFIPRVKKTPPRSEEDVGVEEVGKSGADGSFRVTFKKSAELSRSYVIAHADRLGIDWFEHPADKAGAEDVVLKLVKDQPITGRMLDTEGKPVAGATVGITSIYVPENEKLDDYLLGWKKNWRDTVGTPVKRLYLP